jgi:hypothetical protein
VACEFTDVAPAFAQSDARTGNGHRMYNTPAHKWRLDVNYDHLLGSTGFNLFAAASASENGSARVQHPTVDEMPVYSLYNASVGLRQRDPVEINANDAAALRASLPAGFRSTGFDSRALDS